MQLLDLLLPAKCTICGVSGAIVCEPCQTKFCPRSFDISRNNFDGYAATNYSDDVAKMIYEYKERGQTSLAKFFARFMAPRIAKYSSTDAILVPVPSGRSATTIRGFEPAKILAAHLSRQTKLPTLAALTLKIEAADQATLNRQQRLLNLQNGMVGSNVLRGKSVILVDDIVTTGATLAEARRAVHEAGGRAIFFATFAETILKNQHIEVV